jgi:hypothetical protein
MAESDFSSIALRVALVVLAAAVIILIIAYYSSSSKTQVPQKAGVEKFDTASPKIIQEQLVSPSEPKEVGIPAPISSGVTEPSAWQQSDIALYESVVPLSDDFKPSLASETFPGSYPQDRTTPQDLLPPKAAETSAWAQVAPSNEGDVSGQSFLTAGFHMGKDTIGQSRKNPNLSFRSEPPIQKINVSPWMNSSIEPDTYRRGFEIGSDA